MRILLYSAEFALLASLFAIQGVWILLRPSSPLLYQLLEESMTPTYQVVWIYSEIHFGVQTGMDNKLDALSRKLCTYGWWV